VAELAKAPKLTIGYILDPTAVLITEAAAFEKQLLHDTALAVTWPPGEDLSKPLQVPVFLFNSGQRSAKDLALEIRFSKGCARARDKEADDGITDLRPDGTCRRYVKGFRLDPTMWYRFDFSLRIPKSLTEMKVNFVGMMENYPPFRDELRIRIDYRE
jgi:hypothetical protein